MDRLIAAAAVLVVAAGCGADGRRPSRLLDGRPAARFQPIDGSVIASAQVLRLDGRADACLSQVDRARVAADTAAVERIGVEGESLTFRSRDRSLLYACDAGIDPASERNPPWCHAVLGELDEGRLLDPRLDILCRDRSRRPLAYAFVEPVAGARWIGVGQESYIELFEVLGGLPVRVETTRGIDTESARAALEITQYDADGRELVEGEMEAAVAG